MSGPATHAIHTGFCAVDERDAVLRNARYVAEARGYAAGESDPLFVEHVWRDLCGHRAGGPLPVPTLTQIRAWDLAVVVDVDLAPFGDLDAYNERPEHRGFVSREERLAVLANALPTARDATLANVTYFDVWRFLCVARGGTMLAVPSYRHVRDCWDASIQGGR